MKFCLFVDLNLISDPDDVADIVEGIAHQLRQLQHQRPEWVNMRDLSPFRTKQEGHAALHGVLEQDGQKAAWFSVAEVETLGEPDLEDAMQSDVCFHAKGLYGKQVEGLGPLEEADERPN